MTSESEFFIDEIPPCKKIRTYAKQKPIQLKRHYQTVEVDYENLFANDQKHSLQVGTKKENLVRKRTTLKEITNTAKNRRSGANYRRAKRRGGLNPLLKRKDQEMNLVKQLNGCNDKSCTNSGDGGALNATENSPTNIPADDSIICHENSQDKHKFKEQPVTNDSDAIISSLILNNEPEDIKADYSSFVNLNISAQSQTKSGNNDAISQLPSNCFTLPTTSTPIQRGKGREVADFNIECTPILSQDKQTEKKDSKVPILTENILQVPVHSNDHKELFTCMLVAPVTVASTVKINSINTISHVVRIKKSSCIPLDVLIM